MRLPRFALRRPDALRSRPRGITGTGSVTVRSPGRQGQASSCLRSLRTRHSPSGAAQSPIVPRSVSVLASGMILGSPDGLILPYSRRLGGPGVIPLGRPESNGSPRPSTATYVKSISAVY